jgi:putative aldouronate transport system permease protein
MTQVATERRNMSQISVGMRLKKIRRYSPLFLMVLPGVLYIIINNYLPIFGVMIAFKDYNVSKGILGSDWVGFKNFEYLFKTSDAFIITRNTLLYKCAFIILTLLFSVSIAIMLNEVKNRFLSRIYQTVILFPHLVSMVIVGYLVYALLSMETGYINRTILPILGIKEISWYSEPAYWPYILVIVNLWKHVGYSCIIYLAAIIGIDPEYYEAAKIDGASKWQQIKNITIPMIAPVIIIMTLLAIGKIFYSEFGLFYQVPLDAGALQSTTNVIDTYVYRALLNLGDFGMSSAASLYQSFVGFILVFLANFIVRRVSRDNAMF